MKLATTVLVIVAACDAGAPPPTKPPSPTTPPGPPSLALPAPHAAWISATSAGILAFILTHGAGPSGAAIQPDDLVLVFPLDVTHSMPDRDCRRNPVRATLGDPWRAGSTVPVEGEICYALTDKRVTFDLRVGGSPLRGQVPLLAVMGGD